MDNILGQSHPIAIIGGGPAGLMAAEILAGAGLAVDLYDRMPSVGRKLLMAGRGGLNLTHSEPFDRFMGRYGAAEEPLRASIAAFPPDSLRAWAEGLGQPTFVGSSGRVFPQTLKTSPLLRAWLGRLQELGVRLHPRTEWVGWREDGAILLRDAKGAVYPVAVDATVLALGGASWPRLGADGGWVDQLRGRGIAVKDLRPANCGFSVSWSALFRGRFEGQPLKNIALTFQGRTVRGEAMVTSAGLEGGAIYALSALLREAIAADAPAILRIDLCPDLPAAKVAERLARPRGAQSLSNFLRRTLGLAPVAISLLHEAFGKSLPEHPETLAEHVKSVPITLAAPMAIDRAISTAGGIDLAELDENSMLRRLPGIFAAGEMLDWEAPTGGYLLQACFATGRAAAQGVLAWLATQPHRP